jgi:hypothetical protein
MSGSTNLNALPARVPLWTDEPAYALAERLARRNGVSSMAAFAGDHRLPWREILHGRRNAEIAALAGASHDSIDAATFVVADNGVRLNGEELFKDDWSYRRTRICPSCLRSDLGRNDRRTEYLPHIRSWWNIIPIQACPFHKETLVPRIQFIADEEFKERRLDVRYSADRDVDLTQLAPTPVDEVIAEAYALGRLGFMPKMVIPLLDCIPLSKALRLLDRAGTMIIAGDKQKSKSLIEEGVSQKAISAGFAVFAADESGFIDFLDRLVATSNFLVPRWGPRTAYGSLYGWLARVPRDRDYDHIREIIRKHALDNLPLGTSDLIFGEPVPSRRFYTLRQASRELQIKPETLRDLLRDLRRWSDSDDGKPDGQLALKVSTIQDAIVDIVDRINPKQAEAFLSIGNGPMRNLIKAGLLVPKISRSGRTTRKSFRTRDLSRFVSDLHGNAKIVSEINAPLCDILHASKHSLISASEIIIAMQAGELECRGRYLLANGLGQVLVNLDEVKALQEKKIGFDRSSTIAASATASGIELKVFRKLAKFRFIETTPLQGRIRTNELVNQNSLKLFLEKYVSAAEVAAAQQTHVRILVPKLKGSGIEPSIDKAAVGQYFYERRCVASLLRALAR